MTAADAETWRDPRLGPAHEVRLPAGPIRYHDAGRGPVLVFVHGYLVNANIWRKLVPLLAGGYRCIAVDWPLGSHPVPMAPGAYLSPPGVARLVGDFLDALDLHDVTLVGNDSGGAYAQIAATERPERIARLVLNSCETPDCSWPPGPGGFGLLKAAARRSAARCVAARRSATHRALYQPLRLPVTWRLPNTYGWLAKRPIDAQVMRIYVRPVLTRPAIRDDGRKAICAVSPHFTRAAAAELRRSFGKPVLLAWAGQDRVFPLEHAERYATALGAELRTIADAYTYTAEDQPGRTAELLDAGSVLPPRHRHRDAEPDHREPADPADSGETAGGAGEPVAGHGRAEAPRAVRGEGDTDEDQAEQHHLPHDVAEARVGELRQHRREEHDRLRVGDADREAIPQGVEAAPRRLAADRDRERSALPPRLDAEVHEVGGSGQLQHGEGDGRAFHDGPDPQRHGCDEHVGPDRVAHDRAEGGPPPVGEGPSDGEQHTGAGHHDEQERHRREGEQTVGGHHAPM
ncbi:hypothetical protein GCM10023320_56700 [Pseudonocardia adelaidensis]|uniref:AB hydrolase-1 domain-containing protein n=1 Tax=Pseudonocardia adelaidensis TaxID=648754 RepID=A0ABP9NS49_9PSEU